MSNVVINPYNFGAPPFPNTYSLEFDGVDDYAATGLNLSYVTYPNVTFSVWVKMDKADLSTWSSYNPVGAYVAAFPNCTPIRIYTNGTKVAYVAIQGAGGTTYSTTDISDGNWHSIIQTCEYDAGGSINNVYIDGVKEITDKLFLSWGKITGDLIIGAQTSSNWRFLGNVDEVSVYNSILSAGDIASISSAPIDLTSLSPLVWYRMGDSGTFFNSNWELPNQPQLNNFSSHSMEFDGTDDTINLNCTPTDLGITNNWTISLWVNTSDTTQNYMCYFSGANAGVSQGMAIYQRSNNKIYAYVENYAYNIYTDALVADTWYHIAFTDNGTTQTLYLNGVSQATSTRTYSLQTHDHPFYIASAAGSAYFVESMIDGVSIFNSALDVATILSLYNAGEPNSLLLAASYTNGGGTDKSGDLQAYYRLGESSNWNGTNWQLPDYSKNALFSQKSFEFDGVDESFQLGPLATSLGLSSAISVSIWAKMPAGTVTLKSLIAEDNTGGATRNWNLVIIYNNIYFQLWNADGTENTLIDNGVGGTSRIQDGNWHHVMITYDGTTDADGMKLWVDGSVVKTQTATSTGIRTAAVTTWIGGISSSGTAWNWGGHLDEASTWSEVKVPDDVRDSATATPIDLSGESGLHSWTRMGEEGVWTSLWTLPDESENSYEAVSLNMEEIDLKFDSPTNPNAGLSDGMAIEDKINTAPGNIIQGLSSGMAEAARSTDIP